MARNLLEEFGIVKGPIPLGLQLRLIRIATDTTMADIDRANKVLDAKTISMIESGFYDDKLVTPTVIKTYYDVCVERKRPQSITWTDGKEIEIGGKDEGRRED